MLASWSFGRFLTAGSHTIDVHAQSVVPATANGSNAGALQLLGVLTVTTLRL